MAMETAANQNVVMQLPIQPAQPRAQRMREQHIFMVAMTAMSLPAGSFLLMINSVIYGGYFWALLGTIGSLSCIHLLFVIKYVSCHENSKDEAVWRWAISLVQFAIGAAFPACIYLTKQTQMHIPSWVLFAIFLLQAALTSGFYLEKKEFCDQAVHPLPPEQVEQV